MAITPDKKLLRLILILLGIVIVLVGTTFFSSIKKALFGPDIAISMTINPTQIRPAGAKDSLFVVKNGDRANITVSYKNNTFQDLTEAKIWVTVVPESNNSKQVLLISLPTATTKVNREESLKAAGMTIIIDVPDIKSKSSGQAKVFVIGRQRDTIKVQAGIRTKGGKEVSTDRATITVK